MKASEEEARVAGVLNVALTAMVIIAFAVLGTFLLLLFAFRERGPIGAAGVAGPLGPPGPPGYMGRPGHMGDTGAPGGPGPRGPAGKDGPRGSPGGPGGPGDQGEEGAPGQQGDRGPAGPGAPGYACWDVNQNGICDLPYEDPYGYGDCVVQDCIGPVGYTGAPGPPGPPGPIGPPGPTSPISATQSARLVCQVYTVQTDCSSANPSSTMGSTIVEVSATGNVGTLLVGLGEVLPRFSPHYIQIDCTGQPVPFFATGWHAVTYTYKYGDTFEWIAGIVRAGTGPDLDKLTWMTRNTCGSWDGMQPLYLDFHWLPISLHAAPIGDTCLSP